MKKPRIKQPKSYFCLLREINHCIPIDEHKNTSPKNENFESYINLLRSKNLCSSANRENDWTLDRIAIQEFNLKSLDKNNSFFMKYKLN